MNIKRIIREEVNDFDWIRDVSSDFMSFLKRHPSENGIYKIWIEGISIEDQLTMMDKLYDHGFQWRGGHGRYDTSFVNIPILYLETDTMEIQWDRGEDNRDAFEDREYETPKTQIPTDDFFKVLGMSVNNINESDELDWIKDVKTNQNIAQEIADETKIKNNRLYHPLLLPSPSNTLRPRFLPNFSPTFFTKYCKVEYGLTKGDIEDVWKRYKDIIKDKVNNLNESSELDWIKDVKSNQDIAQEIADKTKIKNNRLYLPFQSSPSPIPYLRLFSLFPFSSPTFFTKYCKVEYGLNKEDENDVWKRYKKLLKNNLKESSDFEWIKDVKSNQDIAQEIADKTKIKDGLSHTPFRSPLSLYPSFYSYHYSPYNPPSSFTEYCKEQYGLTKGDIEDVWKRHKDIIKDKLNNLNESSDFEWVNDSEPTMADNIYGGRIPINTKEAKDNFKKEVNGHYVISAPIENENEETVLAFGSVSYVKRVIEHIHKHFPKDHTLYLATIKYSKKEKDNVLSYIRYY